MKNVICYIRDHDQLLNLSDPSSFVCQLSLDLTKREFKGIKSPKEVGQRGVSKSYSYLVGEVKLYEISFTSLQYVNIVDFFLEELLTIPKQGKGFKICEGVLRYSNQLYSNKLCQLGPKVVPAILLTDKIQKLKRFKRK